ncbi:MAG: hypothetical protein RLZZ156_938 [Deinococcota bacterium]|jgi:hypothetical protein
MESLERGSSLAFNSEKSRSEYMIAPVLLEVRAFAQDQLLIRPHFTIQRNHKQSPIHD